MAAFRHRSPRNGKLGGGEWRPRSVILNGFRRNLRAIATDGPWSSTRDGFRPVAEDMKANGGLISRADRRGIKPANGGPCSARMASTSSRCRRRVPGGADRDAQHRADEPEADEGLLTVRPRRTRRPKRRAAPTSIAPLPRRPGFGEDPGRAADVEERRQQAGASVGTRRPRAAPARQGSLAATLTLEPTTPRISALTAPGRPLRPSIRSKAASVARRRQRRWGRSSTTRWATSTGSRATPTATGHIGTPVNVIAPGKRMLS